MDILGKQEAWLEMQRKNIFCMNMFIICTPTILKGLVVVFFNIFSVGCEQATHHSVFNYNSFIGKKFDFLHFICVKIFARANN